MKRPFISTFLSLLVVASLFLSCTQSGQKTQTESEGTQSPPESLVEQPEWSKNANIYEVNIRQYSEEGTFDAFREDLPRLKEMGVKILWLMPIHPIGEVNRKGPLGSYYSVVDYKEVNPNFGTKEDFRELVDAAHEQGFKIIIDWVANHTAWDSPWTENKDWYELDEEGNFMPPRGTDWTDVIQLDFENKEMRAAMKDAMEYWVREFDIDGYRCDVAGMVPTDFWKDTIAGLKEIEPELFMLAEDGEPELVIEAFNMNYAWTYAHIIREVAKGEQSLEDITNNIKASEANYPESAYRMYFTTNHDENSWTGTDTGMYGANFENFAVLSATINGMPLIYNGQESGLDKQLEFFEKDEIEWADYKYQDFYTTLLELKKDEEALWNGSFGGDPQFIEVEGLYAYSRTKGDSEVVVALNFNEEARAATLQSLEVDNSYEVISGDMVTTEAGEISFGPNEWVIFVK